MAQLNASLNWQEKMKFTATADGHSLTMDAKAPLGTDAGSTPKHLLLFAMAGCPAMDVAALLKKYRQDYTSFQVNISAEKTDPHPQVFTDCEIRFVLEGPVDPEKFKEAVNLSMTKYCGVNAMMTKAVPVHYTLILNNETIHQDESRFT